MIRLWLASETGSRVPIRAGGIVIGRAARSDVVVDDPEVSRVQAIVYAGETGPKLVAVGKAPTAINGHEVVGERELAVGDRLEVATATFTIVGEPAGDDEPPSAWMLRDARGQLVGVTRTPFSIGGGPRADLRVDGWPDVVLRLHLADQLHVEAVAPIDVRGRQLDPGEVEPAAIDTVIAHAGAELRVIAGGATHQAVTAQRRGAPDRVTLEFLPRGGRLTLGWGPRSACAYLPERRCELLAVLLQPPAPLAAGELVSDEILIARLWPGQARTRVDLNVVIHRARADLLRAGIDASLIERATGGVATRVAIDTTTRVAVN